MTWKKKFGTWLTQEESIQTANGQAVQVFSFDYNFSDEEAMSAWAKHFRNHYCPDNKIDILRSGTGLSKKDYLLNRKFPDQTVAPGQVSVRVILVRY